MVMSNQDLICNITSLGFQGEGICRTDGQVTFIPFALPGETVTATITKQQNNFRQAKLLDVLSPAPQRVAPLCPVFTLCGGCTSQHMDYPTQLKFKQEGIQNNLRKIAGIETTIKPVIGLAEPWRYRNKITWQIMYTNGTYQAGFFGHKSNRFVQTKVCFLAPGFMEAAVQALLDELNKTPWLPEGSLQQLVTRTNQEGQLLLVLRVTGDLPSDGSALLEALQLKVPSLQSMVFTNQGAFDEDSLNTGRYIESGQSSLEETILGLRFQLSPFSFLQVNHAMAEKLYDYALAQALPTKDGTLIDIYSGVGTMSLIAAQRCKQVYGLELFSSSIFDAKANAALNQIDNAHFVEGPAEITLPTLLAAGIQADCVLLDPPRKGAHAAVLNAIIKAKPERIVYISCNPASQARDAAVILQGGYAIEACQAFDMFCQTAEVENVITFLRSNP